MADIIQYDPVQAWLEHPYDIPAGVYLGVPDTVYHALPFPSFHGISPLVFDGATFGHYRASRGGADRPTTAMKLGRALHLATLQPDIYAELVDDGPINPKTGFGYGMATKAFAAYEAENPDALLIPPGPERENLEAMAAVTREWPPVKAILEHPSTIIESTGIVDFPVSGGPPMRCKFRPDIWQPMEGVMADLKKTQSAADGEFSRRDIGQFHYYGQAGFYSTMAAALKLPVDHFAFIPCESAPMVWTPEGVKHGVRMLRLGDMSLKGGWDKIQPIMAPLAECIRTNIWPGYAVEVTEINSPAWTRDNESLWD